MYASMNAESREFKHKLAHFHTTGYDEACLDDSNIQGPYNATGVLETQLRSGGVAWSRFASAPAERTDTTLKRSHQKRLCGVCRVD